MKKLALIGAVAALALVGGQAYALDELEIGLDKNVVPVATGDSAVAVGVSNALNGNSLLSNNGGNTSTEVEESYNGGNTFSPTYSPSFSYEDKSSVSITKGDTLVNKAEIKQVVPDAQLGLFAVPLYPSVGAQSQGGPNGHEDNKDQTCCATSVYTGAIGGNTIAGGNGIFGVGLNTGIANQAAVSQINIGHVK